MTNRTVRWLARAASRIFYRIDCIGAPPASGAAIFLPNHPNSLLDPAVVWATADRPVRFLAKSTLFTGPLKPLMVGAGAIPVYRRVDQGVDTSRNAEMFAAVGAALAHGDAICIFPEGVSHSTGRLEPLRTGAARMAVAAERAGTRVALVPVGLNFDRKTAFRSRATVVYGRPFSGRDLLSPSPGEAADAEAVRALTARMAENIRRLMIEADPDADAALVDRVDRLYSAARGLPGNPEERLARRRAIAAGIEGLRRSAPERYEAVLLRLRRYSDRLKRFGLRDRHLDWRVSTEDAVRFAIRELALAIPLVPLCALGFVLFFVPYQATGIVARLTTRHRDIIATAQVIAGALIYGAWLALATAAAWWYGGRAAGLATLIGLPIVAVAALAAIEREAAVVDAVRSWLLLRRASAETRERLRRHRSEIADVLDEVQQWLTGAGT